MKDLYSNNFNYKYDKDDFEKKGKNTRNNLDTTYIENIEMLLVKNYKKCSK